MNPTTTPARLLPCLALAASLIGCHPTAPAAPDLGLPSVDLAMHAGADLSVDDTHGDEPHDLSATAHDQAAEPDGGPVFVGSCSGTLTCAANRAQGECVEIGCSFASTVCIGVVAGCFSLTNEADCDGQAGCSWDHARTSCGGTATACDQLSGTDCLLQAGCDEAFDQCSGTPTKSCADFTIPVDCSLARGCSWN